MKIEQYIYITLYTSHMLLGCILFWKEIDSSSCVTCQYYVKESPKISERFKVPYNKKCMHLILNFMSSLKDMYTRWRKRSLYILMTAMLTSRETTTYMCYSISIPFHLSRRKYFACEADVEKKIYRSIYIWYLKRCASVI